MSHSNKAIVWFNEVGKKDLASVGGKGANLGELTNAQIPVPPGFIVTAQAYYDFLAQTGISEQIKNLLAGINRQDSKQLQQIAEEVQQVIIKAETPVDLVKMVKEAYRKMGKGLVAVRSSATAEDLPDASFAGQQSTFLNVQGESQVVEAIKACWASLFNARAIFYRTEQNYDHLLVGIAVPVQRMVQSEASGVMFTLEPVTSDKDKITIEAVYGLGEAIVSGEVTPDLFIIDKKTMKIVSKQISKQEWQLIKNPNKGELNIKKPIPLALQTAQKITDEEVLQLAAIGSNIEKHYDFPQDIEWAKEGGKLYITQARPVTTISTAADETRKIDLSSIEVVLLGSAASPGMAAGPVKILENASQIDKILKGDILVAEMTTPDFVPAMKRAAAILTDQGGRTSHAAIVSRELGIPCVVGATKATKTLKDGQIVTVDGSSGKVYAGNVVPDSYKLASKIKSKGSTLKTKTKVYVNLAQPDLAQGVADRNVDGVGLLRAEFIMGQIGEHPRYMISQNRSNEFIDKLYRRRQYDRQSLLSPTGGIPRC